jgi:esterase/lipase
VMARVSSSDKTLDLSAAANSWHVLTEDVDRESVYNVAGKFIARISGGN